MSLHTAVHTNNIDEVQKLLQRDGTDVDRRDAHGNTALHLVRDKTVASLLIDACADPNLQNEHGDTPLHSWQGINLEHFVADSVPGCTLDIISLLLDAGASPNIQNNHGYNSLHSLFVYGGIAGLNMDAHVMNDFISLFLQFNADVNMADFEGCTPLHHAVKEPHVLNAETLITSGSLVNARDYRGMTPLQHIYHSDNTELALVLLNHEADINAQDLDGRSTLSTAVEVGNAVMVQLLLQDSRVCVNLADKNKVTPLHLAAAFKHVELTELLIQASADLNAHDTLNATPLHYAAYGGTPEIVTLLLEAGADDKVTDNSGWFAVQYALSRHYYHTAAQFGVNYLHDVATSIGDPVKVADGTAVEDIIVQILPADDIFTMVVPSSKVYSEPFDCSIVPDDLVEYTRAKSAGTFSRYLKDMCKVPGVGQISANKLEVDKKEDDDDMQPDVDNMKLKVDTTKPEDAATEVHNMVTEVREVGNMKAEMENMKLNIEKFMSKWTEKIAEIDERFTGTLLHSGSVYEGTKVGDPDEFDYMLCLEKLARESSISFDEVTEYDKIIVHKNLEESEGSYSELFDGQQLESGKVMSVFVDVAKKALTKLDFNGLVPSEMYIEGLTEHTLVEDTWALHGTVTCNLKFKWAGLYYKQLVITVDLVPAIPVQQWPQIARQASHLLTDDIRSRGCHLVPKAGYWRLSFSLAEKLIMASMSQEQKSAFVGAKVVLHPAVSCKIIVYDDSYTYSDDGLQSDGDFGLETVLVHGELDEENTTIQGNKEVSSLMNEDEDGSFTVGSCGSNKEGNCATGEDGQESDADFDLGTVLDVKDETGEGKKGMQGNKEVFSLKNEHDSTSCTAVGSSGSSKEGNCATHDDGLKSDGDFDLETVLEIDEGKTMMRGNKEVSSLMSEDDDGSFTVGFGGYTKEGNCTTRDTVLETVRVPAEPGHGGVERNTTEIGKKVSSSANEGNDACFKVGSSDSSKDTPTLLATLAGRAVLSQSGDTITILKLADGQDCQMLQECGENNVDNRVTIDLLQEQGLTTDDDSSDVPVKILLPFNILSTYLLKNLFFNCIEENAKNGVQTTVTTGDIFSHLFHSVRESRRIPYYFMPTQSFSGLEALSDDDRCDTVLVTTVINSLLDGITDT